MTENLTDTPNTTTGVPKELKDIPGTTDALPAEPAPDILAASGTVASVESPTPAPDMSPVSAPPTEDAAKLVEDLLETKNPEPIVKAPPPPRENKPLPKAPKKGLIMAALALLLLALPVGVFFISKQNEALTEQRSKATGTGGYGPTYACSFSRPNSCPAGQECHCTGGDACTGSECVSQDWIRNVCTSQGREWCDNMNGFAKTCCVKGYHCCTTEDGCCRDDNPPGDDNGDDDDQPTATPTTGIAPVCQNIKIYKGGQQVTPASLKPGDDVVLAVKGNLNPTKAHFRVNGGNWTETATHNAANEWTLDYKIPTGVTQFVIEGEVFTNGAWR